MSGTLVDRRAAHANAALQVKTLDECEKICNAMKDCVALEFGRGAYYNCAVYPRTNYAGKPGDFVCYMRGSQQMVTRAKDFNHAGTCYIKKIAVKPTCAAGEAHDSNQKCARCDAGTFAEGGKDTKPCEESKCPAGTTDHDSNPATPCTPCAVGVGYTSTASARAGTHTHASTHAHARARAHARTRHRHQTTGADGTHSPPLSTPRPLLVCRRAPQASAAPYRSASRGRKP